MAEGNRKPYVVPVIGIALIVVFATFFTLIYPRIASSTVYLTLGDGIFQAKLATDDSERSKGLSGVGELKQGNALLMIFPTASDWGIWMNDMKIPIDIVWLDSNQKVIYVVTDASPENSNDIVYKPKSAASYVLELPVGTVKEKSIKINNIANFNIDSSVEIK